MSGFDPASFGMAFEKITGMYHDGIGMWLAPIFHIATIVVLFLIFKSGNKHRKLINTYFTINYLWIFAYVGIYMLYSFYSEMGIWSFAFWAIMPILLGNILFNWFKEIKKPKMDYNFSNIKIWRLIVLPIMIFGFWYPTFVYGSGFYLNPGDLLFSFYGLMPCPITMVVLGLMTLKYPDINRKLFNALTLFAVWIGTAQIFVGYVPDYPLALIGYYSLGLIISNYITEKRNSSNVVV